MSKRFREDRFTYKAGDIKVNLSQCGSCKNNAGISDCREYVKKPEQFLYNKEDCPNREEEQE